MSLPKELEEAAAVAREIERRFDDAEVDVADDRRPPVVVNWTRYTLQVSIGDVPVYCDQVDKELTADRCLAEYHDRVGELSKFARLTKFTRPPEEE
jgi:hypothetical protein